MRSGEAFDALIAGCTEAQVFGVRNNLSTKEFGDLRRAIPARIVDDNDREAMRNTGQASSQHRLAVVSHHHKADGHRWPPSPDAAADPNIRSSTRSKARSQESG